MTVRSALFGALAATCLTAAPALADTVKLTTLEWPPYVLADGSGTSTDAVTEVFAKAGHAVTVEVYPWNRAISLAEKDPAYLGVYPEYYATSEDAEAGGSRCLFSKSFGTSPVGFVQQAGDPIAWSSHDDLKAYTIGVVRGYQNEERFDAMVAAGEITTDEADSDALNIRKVAAGRMAAAVIDREVLDYLLAHDPSLTGAADKVSFNDTLLVEHGLHVCFENSDAGRAARDAFDAAL